MNWEEQIVNAVDRLGCLAKFPSSDGGRKEIMRMLLRMVAGPKELEWLVTTMVDRVGEWHGTRELRAVYCTRYKPVDGIEEWSELSGFTALDSEAAHSSETYQLAAGTAPLQIAGPVPTEEDRARKAKIQADIEETAKRLNINLDLRRTTIQVVMVQAAPLTREEERLDDYQLLKRKIDSEKRRPN